MFVYRLFHEFVTSLIIKKTILLAVNMVSVFVCVFFCLSFYALPFFFPLDLLTQEHKRNC